MKFNLDMYTTLYSLNQDSIDRLDSKYQIALKEAKDDAEKAYTIAYDEKSKVGQLMLDNPQAQISITDDFATALSKIAANPKPSKPDIYGSAEGGYYQQVYDPTTNTYKNTRVTGGTGGGGAGSSNLIDVLQEAINNGATPEQAAREAASVSEAAGIPVDQKTLNSLTTQARSLTKAPAPTTTGGINLNQPSGQTLTSTQTTPTTEATYAQSHGFFDTIYNYLFN